MTKRQRRRWGGPEALAEHLSRQCLKEPLVSEESVGGVYFLVASASRMMSGKILVVDVRKVFP